MTEYVFDTEAIIAYLYEEPGHETVATTLDAVFKGDAAGSLSEANASEVFYLVARFEGTVNDKPTKSQPHIVGFTSVSSVISNTPTAVTRGS